VEGTSSCPTCLPASTPSLPGMRTTALRPPTSPLPATKPKMSTSLSKRSRTNTDQPRPACLGYLSAYSSRDDCCPEGMKLTVETKRYRNFAPFVRQTGEGKAQTCANGIFRQQRRSLGSRQRSSEMLQYIHDKCPKGINSSHRCDG